MISASVTAFVFGFQCTDDHCIVLQISELQITYLVFDVLYYKVWFQTVSSKAVCMRCKLKRCAQMHAAQATLATLFTCYRLPKVLTLMTDPCTVSPKTPQP